MQQPAVVAHMITAVSQTDGEQREHVDSFSSDEDEAVFEAFDACLADAGFDWESGVEVDEAGIDEAFDRCDPLLDDLSDELGESFMISPEDEAMFEEFDQCMADAGFDWESGVEVDEAGIDEAFDRCDPLLDDLSDELGESFMISPEDEAMFEEFDQCMADAGFDWESGVEVDEAGIDEAFDRCDPLLEGLIDVVMIEPSMHQG